MLKHTTSYLSVYGVRETSVFAPASNRRASVASETLTGVTQLKIGDVCLLASERSERDSIRGG